MFETRKLLGLIAVAALLLGACASGAQPGDVTFDVELIEIKGSTDGIPPPEVDPTSLSSGYGYKAPGEFEPDSPEKFQVATYMFSPGAMSVIAGDDVTLRLFGVNGDEHAILLEAPDGTTTIETFTINRGREVIVDFTADQAGHYKLICLTHAPTMTADILSISG